MKIFIFILGKANKNRPNGVNQVIAGLSKYLVLNGHSVKLIGLASNAEIEGEVVKRDGFEVEVYSKISLRLLKEIIYSLKWSDICHIHGVYNLVNIFVGKLASRYSTPFVITAHDGFAPQRKKWQKKLFDFLLQKRHMENANAVHVLAKEEATEILSVCTPRRFIYAPNGIDLDDFPKIKGGDKSINKDRQGAGKVTIGYLGRISKEKNLISLVKSILHLEGKYSFCLKLAGPETPYLRELLKYGDSIEIEWVGPKYGTEKIDFIKSLDLFIHPSKADVFSIAAMECLAIGTPLIITRDSKACYFYDSDGFFMCEATSFGISQGIGEAIDRISEWAEISKKGGELVSNVFNWNSAALSILEGYQLTIMDIDNE